MKCPKCGSELEEEWNYCTKCHYKLDNDSISTNDVEEEYIPSKKENTIFWAAVICMLLPVFSFILMYILSFFAYYIGETIITVIDMFLMHLPFISFIASIVLLTIGNSNYPKNKKFKILLKVFITLTVIYTIYTIITMISCLSTCSSEEYWKNFG